MANYAICVVDGQLTPALLLNDKGFATDAVVGEPNKNYINIATEWKVRIRADDAGKELIRIKYNGSIKVKQRNFRLPVDNGALTLCQSIQDSSISGKFIPHDNNKSATEFSSSAK